MTGLYNRRFVEHQLPALIARSAADGEPLAVGLVDLDHFKRINDTHGHEAGDRVLEAVARLLAEHLPVGGSAARLGGEEFLLIMPRTSLGEARRRCEQATAAVASHRWEDVACGLRVTASVGIATSQQATTKTALLRLADRRLYAAKQAGRDRVVAD